MTQPMPAPGGAAGKVLTAFLAGAMFGAFSMVEFAPQGAASATAPRIVSLGGDGEIDPGLADDPVLAEILAEDPGLAGDLGIDLPEIAGPGGVALGGPQTSAGGADPGTTDDPGGGAGPDPGAGAPGPGNPSPGGGSGSVRVGDPTQGGGSGGTGDSTGGGGGGNNGGATDRGITATSIKVAATVVDDGPGASLLQSAKIGMQAVINKTNREGGIAGRRIELTTRNDGWDASIGQQYLRRFIEEEYFALLVVPSSEGLAKAIEAGDISRAQIPVVGSTGLRTSEYGDPWVFPVATATVSIMRIMARHAAANGANTFGIVYDQKYRFGIEGKDAFVDYVQNKLGKTVKAVQPLNPDDPSYGTQAQNFNSQCADCDMVALLLVPETALKWANANPGEGQGRGKKFTYGAQTLFTGAFANSCKGWCNQMVVWTGYVPPIPPVDSAAGVKEYVNDVRAISAGIDVTNQFLEGAYLGTKVFVDAAKACGAALTRQCIQEKLHSGSFKYDLASPLSWSPSQRHANRTAQAFRIEATGGSFNGWQYMQTGWIADPGL